MKNGVKEYAQIGLMSAVICVSSPFVLPLPISPVPVSITSMILQLSLYILGTKRALVSYLVYLLIGLVGLPVFSGFTGGAGKLLGPTGGYLVGFVFMLLLSGFLIERWGENYIICFLSMCFGMAVCYLFGTLWLVGQSHMSMLGALSVGVLPFLFGDFVKILIVALLGPRIQKQLRRAGF